MEKMDQIEKLGNIQKDIAVAANLQRFLEQGNISQEQLLERAHSWFFESLKRELSSRLAVFEAIFTSECTFHSFDNCIEVLRYLNYLSDEAAEFINSYSFDEESEVKDA